MPFKGIFSHVNKLIHLTPKEKTFFASQLVNRKVKRKEILLTPGDTATCTYFIISGCLRSFYLDRDGVEHTDLFAVENWWISDLQSYLTQLPGTNYLEAVEDCELWQLSYRNNERLYQQVPKFERYFRILHQNAFIAQKKRITDVISSSSKDRYLSFCKKYPQLQQRVPQKQIASYLGITPEYLSTLRGKLSRGNKIK